MFKTLVVGAIAVGFAAPAMAQTTYYVIQDHHTHHCRIVDQRPVSHDVTVIGPNGITYKTRVEAETAMKTTKVCTTE